MFALSVLHSPVIARTLGWIQGKLEAFPCVAPQKRDLGSIFQLRAPHKEGCTGGMNGCVICGAGWYLPELSGQNCEQ